jgi:small-conductance mechanosensitive channel
MPSFDTVFLDERLDRWLIAFAVAALTWFVLVVARRAIAGRLRTRAERTVARWDDLLADLIVRTKGFFLVAVGLFAGTLALTLPGTVQARLRIVLILAVMAQTGLWASAAARTLLGQYRSRQLEADRGAATMVGALAFVVQTLIWSVVVLVALGTLGIDVTALVAGLGVGGVAIALAIQRILGDLFASLAIVLDRPFVLKDFIIVDDLLGTVEHIGLKTTRLRALSGEQLIFSNSDLLDSRVRNFGRMYERRVLFRVGVTYQTPRAHLVAIPDLIREAVVAQEGVRFDRSHFAEYGDSALLFETVYFVLSPDYNRHMDIQQAIHLAIHEAFEARGIEFAYPTRTVHLVKE